jgi:hypothetical protein
MYVFRPTPTLTYFVYYKETGKHEYFSHKIILQLNQVSILLNISCTNVIPF